MTEEQVILALTDPQVDQVLRLVEMAFRAIGEGVKTVWILIAPILGIWLTYLGHKIIANQKSNRTALDKNTAISVEAFKAANGHNEKIADAVKLSKDVLTAVVAPQKVEIISTPEKPVHTTQE